FFSSRGRHTRFSRDWSSDVCSSDLKILLRSQYLKHVVWHFRKPSKLTLILDLLTSNNSNLVGWNSIRYPAKSMLIFLAKHYLPYLNLSILRSHSATDYTL